ncbi:DUF6270 domain-containing protein [Phycicoccus sp. Root101]|uniref:DUF6270 domain-containing protein n=1 Tax=Phycicoccus sp. Root101 TaxID=1736421 RepID=UPI000B22997C|nr:DUF6270 domain-containing protein [Phycicoccus sp. Root101]
MTGQHGDLPTDGDYGRYQPHVRTWPSLEAFLEAPVETWVAGVHVLLGGDDDHLDLFVGGRPWMVRAGKCLPVFFSGAVSTRGGAPGPFFSGKNLAREAGTPFLALSDPTLRLDPDLDLGWYTGAPGRRTQEKVTRLLDGVASRLGRELLLVGGSGGGFACLDQSARMREPVSALVWNPQTDLLDYSAPPVLQYLVSVTGTSADVAGGWTREQRSAVLTAGGVGHSVRRPLPQSSGRRRLLYLQNATDDHLAEHAEPYLRAAGWAEGLRGRWYDEGGGIALVAPMSEGHLPPPRDVLLTAFTELLDARTRTRTVADRLGRSGLPGLDPSGSRVRVLIAGSCVSRDTFAFLDPMEFALSEYVARQSLVSAFAGPSEPVIDSAVLPSRFQQRVLLADAAASLPEVVTQAADSVDLVLWDLVDERLGVHRHVDGGLTTDSVEIRSILGETVPDGVQRLPFGSPEHLSLFRESLEGWRELLERTGLLDRTVLLAPLWAMTTDEGEVVPESFGAGADEGNALTEPYIEAAVRVLGVPVLGRTGPDPHAGTTHQWGPAPFHYDDDTYLRLSDEVVAAVRKAHGSGAVSGRGVRVPSAAERAPRRGAPTVSLSRRGDRLAVVLTGGQAKAWSLQLYRGDERVAATSWQKDRLAELPLAGPGVYRVRAHLLTDSGERLPVASPTLRVS